MNGMPRRGELRGVADHALAAVGGDDADGDLAGIRHAVEMRVLHRSGMKRRIWLSSSIRGDEGLGGELGVDHPDVTPGTPVSRSQSR